mmetsp:Transcript_84999/g.150286  ORF Transcript_84999/g.150286 Transcript_84999/m.150286 type:complete len:116 (-) Transcript_84999:176-523(-)
MTSAPPSINGIVQVASVLSSTEVASGAKTDCAQIVLRLIICNFVHQHENTFLQTATWCWLQCSQVLTWPKSTKSIQEGCQNPKMLPESQNAAWMTQSHLHLLKGVVGRAPVAYSA